MARGVHKVVLYRNDADREFTITARKYESRLPGVDQQMSQPGWTRELVAEDLDKQGAEELRDRKREELESRGYAYQTREPLS